MNNETVNLFLHLFLFGVFCLIIYAILNITVKINRRLMYNQEVVTTDNSSDTIKLLIDKENQKYKEYVNLNKFFVTLFDMKFSKDAGEEFLFDYYDNLKKIEYTIRDLKNYKSKLDSIKLTEEQRVLRVNFNVKDIDDLLSVIENLKNNVYASFK